jgi:hypothetical protein
VEQLQYRIWIQSGPIGRNHRVAATEFQWSIMHSLEGHGAEEFWRERRNS